MGITTFYTSRAFEKHGHPLRDLSYSRQSAGLVKFDTGILRILLRVGTQAWLVRSDLSTLPGGAYSDGFLQDMIGMHRETDAGNANGRTRTTAGRGIHWQPRQSLRDFTRLSL
jgi:hypothetical protein